MIYEYLDYRDFLKEEINSRKKLDKSMNFNNFAKALNLKKPQLSKVIHGWQHFSRDHVYQTTRFLNLTDNQSLYFENLHDYQTSNLPDRKEALKARIDIAREKRLETNQYIRQQSSMAKSQITRNEYYLDPMHQIVHMAVSIEKYQNDIRNLAFDLSQPKEVILTSLQKLENWEIIKRDGAKYVDLAPNLHLSPDSDYYKAWSQLIRIASTQQLQKLKNDEAYAFAGTFTADEKAKNEIQKLFLEFIRSAQKIAVSAPGENIYQLNFDLFGWTQNQPLKVSF